MEKIKIVCFVIGSFFGIENSRIGSEKVTVTVNPIDKTIIIVQENLFSVIRSKNDSLSISKEFLKIYEDNWLSELKDYSIKSLEFYSDENHLLNAKITLHYTSFKDLKTYAIDVNQQGDYSIINIPEWNLKTEDGKLNGNYWNFNASKPFTFTLEAFKNMPEAYEAHKKSVYTIWEATEKK